MEETFRQKMMKIWRTLKREQFRENDVRPALIVLACAIITTLIYNYGLVHFTVDNEFIEGFIYTSLINAASIIEMAIYLKIALAILKKRSKFNVLLGQTVLFMSAFVIVSAAVEILLMEEVLTGVCILSASIYCFFLLRKMYGISRVHSIIISAIYLFICSQQLARAVILIILGALESFV